MRRITCDSNIYISALNFGGKPLEILELARTGRLVNAISNAIITETSRVLYAKFYWSAEDIHDAIHQLLNFSNYVHAEYTLDVVSRDPEDNRVLECAVAAKSDVVITGDLDLLMLGSFGAIQIVSPAQYLKAIQEIDGGGTG